MSNFLAIAAVTATLRNLLTRGLGSELGSGGITTRPLDKARERDDPNQINLFLYHLVPDPAWRNRELPNQTRPGETGQSPLPLKLYYLMTAYGRGNDDTLGHRILGRAMQILHDNAILNPADIQAALSDSDLQHQVDRIRLSLQPVSLDEMSKLWSSFQTQFRISVAYEVSVVLIESRRASRTPLPVLTIGNDNSGIVVQPNLMLPFPALETAMLRDAQSVLTLGAPADQPDLLLIGQNLDGGTVRVLFQHSRLAQPLEPILLAQSPAELQLRLPPPGDATDPSAPANQWLVGLYRVKATIGDPAANPRSTNELAIALAPKILSESLNVRRDPPGNGDPYGKVTITLRCLPTVARSQSVSLLLGDRELPWLLPPLPDPPPANPDLLRYSELRFEAKRLPSGVYWMRLRVDGIDSPLIINRAAQPSFDPTQQVTLP
ncbi:DUF4255 domain-containing protein [Leptolyngbya ohadii]|uniref:DUF4255 domain-containing protein n=1 Tax=Leptolyngbya ohadii TaxID=1962290 RepID=UPI000B59B333|nr:DUF4255 domain-containing protein [Leptolyngbya ohadii]